MKTALIFPLVLLLATPVYAETPTEASVVELLSLTHSEANMEKMYASVEQLMRQSFKQATAGQKLSAEQQRFLDLAPHKFVAVMRQEFGWSQLKPTYVQIYRETFDQQEIDGLIAFYKSPVGQAFIAKMPIVLQRTIEATQARMKEYYPHIKTAIDESLKEAGLSK